MGFASLAVSAVVHAQAESPARPKAIDDGVSHIAANVAVVSALKDKALREGRAVKASCIEENLRRLSVMLQSAQGLQSTWAEAQSNPAYAQRTRDRIAVLTLTSD